MEGQTDRKIGMTKAMGAFRNFANRPENVFRFLRHSYQQ